MKRALRAWLSAAVVALVGLGCSAKPTDPSPSRSASVASLSPSAPSSPQPSVSDAVGPARVVKDPLFVRASTSHDEVDARALGSEAGASALVAALSIPSARATALQAIPFARDSDLALRPLANAANSQSGDASFELLDTIARITEEPRRIDELLDAEGAHLAAADLMTIAKDTARSERERALAATILGRLADRGFVARGDIPTL